MRKYGIHYAAWGNQWEVDVKERIRLASEVGFRAMDLTPPDFIANHELDKMQDLKKCADYYGIELCYCIGFPEKYDMANEDRLVRRAGIEYTKRLLEAISKMDGKILSGILYSSWPYDFRTMIPKKRMWELALESVKECTKTAEDYGITYAIELVNRFEQCLLNGVDEGIEFVNQVGSPACKLLLDVFHLGIEETDTPDAIRKAGKLLAHMHVSQNNRKIPAPCANMPWQEIARAVSDIGFEGNIVMEPFVLSGGPVAKDVNIWRDLIDDTSVDNISKELKCGLDFIESLFGKEGR